MSLLLNNLVTYARAALTKLQVAAGAKTVVGYNATTGKMILPDGTAMTAPASYGTGVDTFLTTPSSANLKAALTDETGSGAAVFANTPTLVTPVIGAATGTSLELAAGGAAGRRMVVSDNATPASAVAGPAGTLVQFVGADSVGNTVLFDTYAAAPQFVGRRATGTIASKTAVTINQNLAVFEGRGYGATTYSGSVVGIRLQAAETFTDATQATQIVFMTTPTGSITTTEAGRVTPSGDLWMGGTPGSASKLSSTVADGKYQLTLIGTTKALRFGTDAAAFTIAAVDNTLSVSFQPLIVNGSTLNWRTGNLSAVSINAARDVSVDAGNLVLPKTSGVGIMVDTTTPTFGWKDIIGQLIPSGGGVSPSFNVFRGTLRAYQFTVNDEISFAFHIPHDYAPGTDIYVHVHWAHASAAVTSGAVTWSIVHSYAKGHNQAAFPAEKTVTVTQNASTTQYQHMIAEAVVSTSTGGGTATLMDRAVIEPDGLLLVRMFPSANTVNGTPEPFVFTCDVHYQSTQLPTKNKAPNFYA